MTTSAIIVVRTSADQPQEERMSIDTSVPQPQDIPQEADDLLVVEELVEEISIDGMCGVY